MLNRLLQPVRLAVGISGVLSLLVTMNPWDQRESAVSDWGSPGGIAEAQRPEAQLRYRVREQLAGINFPNEAVGSTHAIEGSIALDAQGRMRAGDSRVTVDLRRLQSDRDGRDNYLRRNTLEAEHYPTAVFVPTDVRGLRFPLPQTGTASFELDGDLTMRDTTRRTSWKATATFNGPELRVQANTAFRFADFGLTIPQVASVLSVEDNIRLEVDLLLQKVPGT